MNSSEAFLVKLIALAGMCNFNLSSEIIQLYEQKLSRYGLDVASAALDEIIQNRRGRDGFPSIRDIREMIQPESDSEAEAIEAVGRIVYAVARIGPYRSQDAKEFIGELGWFVVTRDGGWEYVCQTLSEENMGTMKAQWRGLAMSQFKRAKSGVQGPPNLPSADGKVQSIGLKALLFSTMPAPKKG